MAEKSITDYEAKHISPHKSAREFAFAANDGFVNKTKSLVNEIFGCKWQCCQSNFRKSITLVIRGVDVTHTSIDFWSAELIVTLKKHLHQKRHIARRAIHMHRKLVARACECAMNHLEVLSLSQALLTPLQAISVRVSNSWLSFKSFASADKRWYERCFLFPFHNITNWKRCLAFPPRISQFVERCVKVLASFLVCVFKAFICNVKLYKTAS